MSVVAAGIWSRFAAAAVLVALFTLGATGCAPRPVETIPPAEAPVAEVANTPLDAVDAYFALLHREGFTCDELFQVITRNPDNPSAEVAKNECTVYTGFASTKRDLWPEYEVLADTLFVDGETAEVQVVERAANGTEIVSTIDLAVEDGKWKVAPRRL